MISKIKFQNFNSVAREETMKTAFQFPRRLISLVCSVFVVVGCAPEDTSAPPLFNAIDPSLQCPAGQVGWDFTTGGNEGDVIVARVGSEIKIQEVKYECRDSFPFAFKDMTASFRAECDNGTFCERPILRAAEVAANNLGTCVKKSLKLTYKCGNEPTLYDISRTTFSPGYSEYNRLIVQQPANEPTQVVTLACGETINVLGQSFKQQNGNQSVLSNDRMSFCNGKRRCFDNRRLNTGSYYFTSLSHYTKYFYTCGTNPTVREYLMNNEANTASPQNYIDFHCADKVQQTGYEPSPSIFLKGVEFKPLYSDGANVSADTLKNLDAALKTGCEGRRSCAVSTSVIPATQGIYTVEYWCGASKSATERKRFHTNELLGNGGSVKGTLAFDLQCGGRLRVADANQAWVARDCPEGTRVCSLPPNEPETMLNFFCETSGGGESNTIFLNNPNPSVPRFSTRSLECPLETKDTGIRITGLNYDGSPASEKPPVSAISVCNNKQTCLVRPYSDNNNYQYRFVCPNAAETTSVKKVINGQNMEYLDCKPNANVTGAGLLVPDFYESQRLARYAPRDTFCESAAPSCTVDLTRFYSPEGIRAYGGYLGYKCGGGAHQFKNVDGGAFERTADGGHLLPDGGSTLSITVTCPYDPTPRATASTKKCVPATCPNNKKRNAELDCVDDAQILVKPVLNAVPTFENTDWSDTTTLKEGFPYIHYMTMTPFDGLSRAHAGTTWAYDVFKRKDGTGPEIKAFRCLIASQSQHGDNAAVYGSWQTYDSSILPDDCFKEPPYGDLNSSWYHGSRRASGVMNEQVFRNTYNKIRTMVVPAFDSKGRVVRANRLAPNPIGFFYTPATGYIDQFDFLAQTSQFENEKQIVFQPSRQMELSATSGKLGVSQIVFDKETFKNPPILDLDFGWKLLGDSPFHPMSDRALAIAANVAQLKFRNPRATVEIAKEDSALPNKWVAENMAVVSSFRLGTGNAQERKERFNAQLTEETVKRVMSVKGAAAPKRPDGWMSNNIEVNSVFKARICIDFDGISRAPGDTALNDKFVTASVNNVDYKLGVTRRCTDEYPFTVTRDLFPKPVLPVNAAENPIGKADTKAQGGERVSSDDDLANQSQCRRSCTVNGDCGAGGMCEKPANAIGVCKEASESVQCKAVFRKNAVLGGKAGFGYSIAGINNSGDSDAPGPATRTDSQITGSRTNVALMNFNILDSEEKKEGQLVGGGTKRETSISLGRIWASVAAVADAVSKLQKSTNPSPVKPWWKKAFSSPVGGKNPLPGIAFGVGTEGFVFAGPVILHLEISFGAQLTFDLIFKWMNDKQTIATKTPQAIYPCLGTAKCLKLSTEAKAYEEANEDCSVQGGRLAEARDAAALTAIKSAAGTTDIWIGAQASHIFDDPTCADLSNVTEAQKVARLAACKAVSVTRYLWVNGDVAFADTTAAGATYNTALYASKHGFGTLSSIPNNGGPLRSALMLKGTGTIENQPITDKLSATSSVTSGVALKTAKYVCEFDGAGAYKASAFTITPQIEFSIGLSASACWPHSTIGACLSAEFKFITASVAMEYGNSSVKIYDTASTVGAPRATIGATGWLAKAEVAFLTGRLFAEIRFFIGSKEYNIVSYSGVWAREFELWDGREKFRRNAVP
jgi:hypothetical protein